MNNDYALELRFKGDRDYLHGTDVFNSVLSIASEHYKSPCYLERIEFSKVIRCPVLVTFAPTNYSVEILGRGKIVSSHGNKKEPFILSARTGEISGRYEYDESEVLAHSQINRENRSISLSVQTTLTPIEKLISMTKVLNSSLYPPVSGKWLFGQYQGTSALPQESEIARIVISNIIPDKFSKCSFSLDGINFGTISFIVGSI